MPLNASKRSVVCLLIGLALTGFIAPVGVLGFSQYESPPDRAPGDPRGTGGCGQCGNANSNHGVHLFSGEFHLSATDLRIAGRGLDFSWSRKYRSQLGPNTSMGNGWDFSYNIYIEQSGPDLLLHDGNTREDLYLFDPVDNNWTADAFFSEFTFDPNPIPFGSYTLTFPDTGEWRFNPLDGSPQQGKIGEISERNGNTMVFEYNGLGQLATIHDTLDTAGHTRDITITYDPNGFIQSVTDFTGRSVTYEYYDGIMLGGNFGDLRSVTTPPVIGTPNGNDFPSGKTTMYTYSTGLPEPALNGNLLTITDPKGQTFLTNEYAPTPIPIDLEFDRVIGRNWGKPTDRIDIVYAQLIPDPENNFSVVKATVNDRVGNVSEHFFNGGNQPVIVREHTGRADPALPTDIDLAINPPTGPLRPGDDPAFFETRYEWSVDALPTVITNPNGNSAQCVYEIDLNPLASQRESGNLREIHFNAGPLGGDQATISHSFNYEPGFGSGNVCLSRHSTSGSLGMARGTMAWDTTNTPDNDRNAIRTTVHDGSEPLVLRAASLDPGCDDRELFAPMDWHDACDPMLESGLCVSEPRSPATGAVVPFELCPLIPSNSPESPIKFEFTLDSESFCPRLVDEVVLTASPMSFEFADSERVKCDFGSKLVSSVPWEADSFVCVSPPRSPATDAGVEFRVRFGAVTFAPDFVTLHTDGRGNQTQQSFDTSGNRLQTVHRIPSIVENFEYNAFGQLTKHTWPDNGSGSNREDNFTYYDPGFGCMNGYQKEKIIDAPGFGLTTTYEYDCLGRMTRSIDPQGNDSTYDYNSLDQTVKTESRDATGGGVRYERLRFYDPNDNIVRIDIEYKDDAGALQPNTHFSTVYEYDILNYLTRSCREVGNAALGPTDLDCSAMAPSESVTTEIEYDANRNPILVEFGEAANGNQPNNSIQVEYDERDLVFRVTRGPGDADQSTGQANYDGNGNVTSIQRGLEGPVDVPPALVLETVYVYDGFNRLTRVTDPMGNDTEFHFDPNGNIGGDSAPASPNPFGIRWLGELIDVPGDAGNDRLFETTYEYDTMDRMTRQLTEFFDTATQAPLTDGQSITTLAYSDNSQLILISDDNAHSITATYDTANRVASTTDAKSNSSTFAYDPNSNIILLTETEKSDLGSPDEVFLTMYAYDNLDRMTRITDNIGNASSCAYDSRSNRTLQDDALGHETRYAYDGMNRLTRITRDLDGDGADGDGTDIVIIRGWDDSTRLIDLTDDIGNVTTYEYDSINRLTRQTYADCTEDSHTYDVHDNRLTTTDANGSTSTRTYDLLNRQATNAITPGTGVSGDTTFETYAYDGLSRFVLAVDDDSNLVRGYDSLSNLTQEQLTIDFSGTPTVGTVMSTFDGARNHLTCDYPGGRVITCTYDELNRKKTISDGGGSIASYDYIGPRRVERREYGNGTRTDDAYDGIPPNPPGDFGVRQIVGTTHTVIGSGAIIDERTYIWDAMYNRVQRKDIRVGGTELTHDYVYDSIYRLTRTIVTDPTPATVRDSTYTLDGAGNRSSVSGNLDTGIYAMDPTLCEPGDLQMNQYSNTPFDSRAYDPNGNLTGFGCLLGDLDGDNTITVADAPLLVDALLGNLFPPCGADVNGDGVENGLDIQVFTQRVLGTAPLERAFTIAYDYRNQMVEFVDSSSQQRHEYAYDALGRRIQRTVDADAASDETRYFYDGFQVVEEQDQTGTTGATYAYGLYIDEVLNMQRGGGEFYCHTDDLFSVTALTDGAGAGVERYEYDDYGVPEIRTLAQAADLTAAAASDQDLFLGNVQILADDFSFAQPTRISGLRWWGAYSTDPNIPATDDFTIRIYADDGPGGAPGTLIHEEIAGDLGRVATGRIIVFASLTEYVYEYRLVEPIDVPASSTLWLVIAGDTTGHNSTWGWDLSADGNSTVAVQIDGGPWQLDFSTDLAFEFVSDTSSVGNPYLFTGRRYDSETGLYYYRTRYMQPRAGRFTTRDTLGMWGDGLNLGNGYTYAGNRPTSALDPTGMQVPPTGPMMPGQSMGWWGPGGTIIAVSYWGPGIRMGGYQWFVFTPTQIATFLSPPGFPFGFLPIPTWGGGGIPQGPGGPKGMLGCLDASSEIVTPDGPRPIGDVQIGDAVLTPEGDFRKVVDKDFGRVWTHRRSDYVNISTGTWSVVLTRDHVIAGRPAGEWHDGEMMPLRDGTRVPISVRPAQSAISGDLRLEGDADYVTRGGFVIGSMMSRYEISSSKARARPDGP